MLTFGEKKKMHTHKIRKWNLEIKEMSYEKNKNEKKNAKIK